MQKLGDNLYILIFTGMGGMFILAVSFILMHVQSQNKFLKQKGQAQKLQLNHQQELLETVIRSQEAERKRIGQDLHDDVGTALSNLRLTIDLFGSDANKIPGDFSRRCKTIIDQVITDVRHISHNLSPPGIELYGFLGALEDLCDSISQTSAMQISIHNEAAEQVDALKDLEAISVYRIMEELLHNTIKHAGAAHINIHFSSPGALTILYADDGTGIPTEVKTKKGMGLHNIESRLKMIGASTLPTIQQGGYQLKFQLKI